MAILGMDVGGILLTWLHDYMGGNRIGRDWYYVQSADLNIYRGLESCLLVYLSRQL